MPNRLKQHPVIAAVVLTGILLFAASLRLVRLEQNGFGTPYYAAAVRSMSMNWHNLFYAAFDPSGFLAIDKPPVAFWLQVASVQLLGFDGFALHLPQAIEGVAAVGLLFYLARRSFGLGAGFLAGLFLAITPISVAVDRSNNTDSCLVLMQILAAWPLIVAAERANLLLLLLSAALLGVAFNVKMAASLLVLPGFITLYAFTAPAPWSRRIVHLVAAAITLTAVSLSWTMAVDLTPKASRPYIDSTDSNSMWELAIGHNAFDRFVRPNWLSIVLPRDEFPPGVPAGPLRLAAPLLASQIGWLAPLAVAGLWLCRAWPVRLLWGGWACACLIVFSAAGGIVMPYYLADMAPPLAVLAAIGVMSLRRPWHIAPAIILSAAWQAYIVWGDGVVWRDWLIGIPVAAALISVLLLLVGRPATNRTAVAQGVVGLLAAPLAWSLGAVLERGSPISPTAHLTDSGLASIVSGPPSSVGDGLPNRKRLLALLSKRRGTTVLATSAISEASSIIIRTGNPVLVLGGYTGVTPVVSQTELERRIDQGEVRFVLIGGSAANNPASPLYPLAKWVRETGREIEPAVWRPAVPTGSEPLAQRRAVYLNGLNLYDFRPE